MARPQDTTVYHPLQLFTALNALHDAFFTAAVVCDYHITIASDASRFPPAFVCLVGSMRRYTPFSCPAWWIEPLYSHTTLLLARIRLHRPFDGANTVLLTGRRAPVNIWDGVFRPKPIYSYDMLISWPLLNVVLRGFDIFCMTIRTRVPLISLPVLETVVNLQCSQTNLSIPSLNYLSSRIYIACVLMLRIDKSYQHHQPR